MAASRSGNISSSRLKGNFFKVRWAINLGETVLLRVVVVCGNKYAFRSVYVPIIRDLRGSRVDLVLLDYPEDYEIAEVLNDLKSSNLIQECTFIPSNSLLLRHHVSLAKLYRSLLKKRFDRLVVDGDFMPMHQYLIVAARAAGAYVIAVQKEVPVQLLTSYIGITNGARSVVSAQAENISLQRIHKVLRVLRRPVKNRIFNYGLNRLDRVGRFYLEYRVIPWILTGHHFDLSDDEWKGLSRFAAGRVDCAVVYDERIKAALNYFYPELEVLIARHPCSDTCRCGSSRRKSKLLILLGGPWDHYISRRNSSRAMQERWEKVIVNAAEKGSFSEVHIRPHPRETKKYPYDLADKLSVRGIAAKVLDGRRKSLPEIVCEYAVVLGAPSGALVEASISCRDVSVIGLDRIEGQDQDSLVKIYSSEILSLDWESPLSDEHFIRRNRHDADVPSVAAIIKNPEHACHV